MSGSIGQKQALSVGDARYFTGNACKRGHISERFAKNATCVDCSALSGRLRYEANPASAVARAASWATENRERVREIKTKWRLANVEEARALERASRRKYPNTAKSWKSANAEQVRALKRNRKARLRAAEGHHCANDIEEILDRQSGKCVYCQTTLKGGYHVDHIIAISRGGSNWPFNLQILCASCNLQKGTKDHMEFARLMRSRGYDGPVEAAWINRDEQHGALS